MAVITKITLLTLMCAIHHCQVSTVCNTVPRLDPCPQAHGEDERVLKAWFERDGKRVPGEPVVGGSRRYNETVSADMNGTRIQCKAVLGLSDGSNRTHVSPAYIIEVVECPVSTTVGLPTYAPTTITTPSTDPGSTGSIPPTATSTLNDGVAVGMTLVLLVIALSLAGSFALCYFLKNKQKNSMSMCAIVELGGGGDREDSKKPDVVNESMEHLDEDTSLLRTAPTGASGDTDTAVNNPSQTSENLQRFANELAPNNEDPIAVMVESIPSTSSENLESSNAQQCVESVNKPLSSPADNAVVCPVLRPRLLKLETVKQCALEGSAEVDYPKPTPTSDVTYVSKSSCDPKAMPTSSACEDCPNTPKTPVQESFSAQPTPIEKNEFVFPGVKVPPAQLSLSNDGGKTTSVFSTALEKTSNLNVQHKQ